MKKLSKITDGITAMMGLVAIWMILAFMVGAAWGGGAVAFKFGDQLMRLLIQHLFY